MFNHRVHFKMPAHGHCNDCSICTGSLLSIGSAAGVALMGQARGMYTFFGHLRWTPVIALGYIASILVHMWINAVHF